MRLRFLFPFLLAAGLSASAQYTEKIETDRPDQTETPFLVPKKYFQAEFGLNVEKYTGNYDRFVHPTSLLKYGLTNRFELRLESTVLTNYLQRVPSSVMQTQMEPLEVGTKIRLFEEKGLRPKASVIAHVGLPFLAGKAYRSLSASYTTRLSLQNSLSKNVSLGYNLGVEGGGGESTAFFYTVAPGFNIGEKWYAYAEAFGSFANEGSLHHLDGGLAFFLSPDTKVDLSAGFGLGDSPLKHYTALGFSFRLPVGRR